MNTNVLKACHEFNVEKVIAILSTCIYPDKVETYPMKEEDLFGQLKKYSENYKEKIVAKYTKELLDKIAIF